MDLIKRCVGCVMYARLQVEWERRTADVIAASIANQTAKRRAADEKSFGGLEEEIRQGQTLLTALTHAHLGPYERRRHARLNSLHATWDAAVYQPLRHELEVATTQKVRSHSCTLVSMEAGVFPHRQTSIAYVT